MQRTTVAVAGTLVLLGALTACVSEEPTFLTMPKVFYVPPYGEKSVFHDPPEFTLQADGGAPYPRDERHHVTVEVQQGAKDVVRLRESGPDCRAADPAHVSCDVVDTQVNGVGQRRILPVAAKGARAGDSAFVKVTFGVKGGKKLTARTKVVVGEPVVQALVPKPFQGVRPGAGLTAPLIVRNTGAVPVRGLGIELKAGQGEFAERHSGCRYPDREDHFGAVAICRLPDVRIAPGETVALRPGLRLRASDTTMYDGIGTEVWPLDAEPPIGGHTRRGDEGDGPALQVTAGTAHLAPGTFETGGGTTPVSLRTHADYEVTGATLRGDPGDTRELRVTVRNNGPGDPGAAAELIFEKPLDSGVLKEPMTEIDDGQYGPYCETNLAAYTCPVEELAPGKSRTFEFTLRLGAPGAGRVSVRDTEDATRSGLVRHDPHPANDEAAVTVEK
ncbi:DUF11 domain-containing protein [Streptomyces gilvus]|uniref:DUF11 domain-containing protein n=1 Tax=Streptomyces gilvus TaxID=2920937 RepID=UPI001F108046|nr:DUF11 domain-containing protein [Streptomyces sp. CME 23]MCH5675812.1 DUF11 domain-containing protein [Streptomyces sp. CME 23]